MTYTDRRHHEARFAQFPKGFSRHRGKMAPVKGRVYIELVHKTDEGYAISPRRRADLVTADEWASGSIKGWQLAPELPVSASAMPEGLAAAIEKLVATLPESHPAPDGYAEAADA